MGAFTWLFYCTSKVDNILIRRSRYNLLLSLSLLRKPGRYEIAEFVLGLGSVISQNVKWMQLSLANMPLCVREAMSSTRLLQTKMQRMFSSWMQETVGLSFDCRFSGADLRLRPSGQAHHPRATSLILRGGRFVGSGRDRMRAQQRSSIDCSPSARIWCCCSRLDALWLVDFDFVGKTTSTCYRNCQRKARFSSDGLCCNCKMLFLSSKEKIKLKATRVNTPLRRS